ncbi:MAG: methylation-associated defense system protein MAD4 [Chthoniobacteraceae bacterium]
MKDLVVLVADKQARFALTGAFGRPESLGIRPITFDFREHIGRDGGTRATGPEVLALEHRRFSHALLVLDHEGCGEEDRSSFELEAELDARLERTWGGNAKAIVIDPELDIWIWGSSNSLQGAIEWRDPKDIRAWLIDRKFVFDSNGKPKRPKEAIEAALHQIRMPRSAALYQRVAKKISLRNCTDPAFSRLRSQLEMWFPK